MVFYERGERDKIIQFPKIKIPISKFTTSFGFGIF